MDWDRLLPVSPESVPVYVSPERRLTNSLSAPTPPCNPSQQSPTFSFHPRPTAPIFCKNASPALSMAP